MMDGDEARPEAAPRGRGRRFLLRFARTLLVVYGVIALLLYFFQRHLVFPVGSRELVGTPAMVGLDHEDVALVTEDGVKLHGWWVPRADERGVALFFHGNAGNVSHRTQTIGLLHALGLSTLIIDYRGYGQSEGEPSEEGLYRDADAAWRHLVGTRRREPARIVVWGRSLGTGVAVDLAARERPAALVVESGFTSIPDVGAHLYPWLPVRLLARIHFDSAAKIERVRAPKLFLHSPADEIIPYELGRALFAEAPEPKRFVDLRGGHNDGFLVSGADYLAACRALLDEALPPR